MDREKELWGHKFKMVENGLDETEVYSFIDTLTHEYGNLSKKIESLDTLVNRLSNQYQSLTKNLGHDFSQNMDNSGHLSTPDYSNPEMDSPAFSPNGKNEIENDKLENLDALTKFAERTVIEAAKQAHIIKNEIEGKAKAEASNIIAHAKQEAVVEADKIMASAETKANHRGEEILAVAQRKADELVKAAEQGMRVIPSSINDESTSYLSEANLATAQELSDCLKRVREKVEESSQSVQQEAERLLGKSQKITQQDIKEVLKNISQSFQELQEIFEIQQPQSTEQDSRESEPVEIETSESLSVIEYPPEHCKFTAESEVAPGQIQAESDPAR